MGLELLRVAYVPAAIVVGLLVSRATAAAARRVSARLMGGLLLIAGVAVASGGAAASYPGLALAHRWSGHALVIAGWMALPWMIGAALQRQGSARPLQAILSTAWLVGILALMLLCSFTGYLPNELADGVGEETRNRFVVLHKTVLPTLLMLAVLTACWRLSGKRDQQPTPADRPNQMPADALPADELRADELRADATPNGEPERDPANPYRSPRATD